MRLLQLLPPLLLLPFALASDKRGLVQVDTNNPNDEQHFLTSPTTLTWYYNYRSSPSASIRSLEFVPMLWGEPASDYDFATEIRGLLRDSSNKIEYVLGFNEPDMGPEVGGSNMSPDRAVEIWKQMIEPLKNDGVKLGAPGIASTQAGKAWLKKFAEQCDNCTIDFIPIHWYGNFEGLASWIGEIREMFPDKDMWVTEFGYAHQSLTDTYHFFNSSIEYLDRIDYIKRYAWFGSFRSDVSNVGPNGAMLDRDGDLTDLGAWYLGKKATGNTPASAAVNVSTGWAPLSIALCVAAVVAVFA